MRRVLGGIVLLALVVVLIPGCGSNSKLAAKDAEIMSLRSEMDGLEKALSVSQVEKLEALERSKNLEGQLEALAAREKLLLEEQVENRVLRLPDRVLFHSGQVSIRKSGKLLLDRVANVLKQYPDHEIRIEGHTDDRAIKPVLQTKYPTNWELSASRATAVVRYLTKKHGLSPTRMAAVGRGEHNPVATNDTPRGREANRRVELHIAKVPTFEELTY